MSNFNLSINKSNIKHSPTIGLYEATLSISIDYKNKINILKHRYEPHKSDLSIDDTINIMMDMLCRKVYDGRMIMFQEAMKINLCKAIKETLKGGDIDEDTL
jgi:hypothetical protein